MDSTPPLKDILDDQALTVEVACRRRTVKGAIAKIATGRLWARLDASAAASVSEPGLFFLRVCAHGNPVLGVYAQVIAARGVDRGGAVEVELDIIGLTVQEGPLALLGDKLAGMLNRRTDPRLPCRITAVATFGPDGEGPAMEATICDLSAEGCRVEGPPALGRLSPGTPVTLTIEGAADADSIELRGEVRTAHPSGGIGVRIFRTRDEE